MTNMNAIEKAVDLAGGVSALAAKIGVSPPAVSKMLKKGIAPAARCISIESAVNGAVTRYELRRDVFGEK